ncbi:MAG: lamin tail domain-containing protein [Planctomycetes bacterium]|nr:lamin tail domain-containing protein [Planctomycetota bacterium]
MNLQRLTGLLALSLLAANARAQLTAVRVNELLLTPTTAGGQLVELKNHGSLTVDFTGWQLVTAQNQLALPSQTLPVDHTVVLHLGAAGTNTPTDIYLPGAAPLLAADTISLFRSAAVSQPSELIDFVSFGGGLGGIQLAVLAGQWPSPADSIGQTPLAGQTLAHHDAMLYGSGDRPQAWFVDGTPTLGASNDAGGIFAAEWGCPGLAPYPVLGSGEEDNRPWIGESWLLDAYFLPPVQSTMWVAIGTTYTGPMSLGGIGMPNCFTSFQPYAIQAHVVDPLSDELTFSIPNHTALVGMRFLLQGLVSNYPNLNPAGLAATRVTYAFVGSR